MKPPLRREDRDTAVFADYVSQYTPMKLKKTHWLTPGILRRPLIAITFQYSNSHAGLDLKCVHCKSYISCWIYCRVEIVYWRLKANKQNNEMNCEFAISHWSSSRSFWNHWEKRCATNLDLGTENVVWRRKKGCYLIERGFGQKPLSNIKSYLRCIVGML